LQKMDMSTSNFPQTAVFGSFEIQPRVNGTYGNGNHPSTLASENIF